MNIVLKKMKKLHKRPFVAALICNFIELKCYCIVLIQVVLFFVWELAITSYDPDYQFANCLLRTITIISVFWCPMGIVILIKSLIEWLLFLKCQRQHSEK